MGCKWNYVCNLIDLHNREIIGSAAGEKKYASISKNIEYGAIIYRFKVLIATWFLWEKRTKVSRPRIGTLL